MDREQAINLVNLYDGHFPEEFIETYLKLLTKCHYKSLMKLLILGLMKIF